MADEVFMASYGTLRAYLAGERVDPNALLDDVSALADRFGMIVGPRPLLHSVGVIRGDDAVDMVPVGRDGRVELPEGVKAVLWAAFTAGREMRHIEFPTPAMVPGS